MKNFSFANRIQNLNKMKNQEFDLVIIGGGINGAGVARDASARGMKVALIEARDFASGTSSKSSKLIHGGIRYLENLEFKLVFEALNERTRLFEMAPHLVHPLRFMIPLYEESRVGMTKMGLGMWLYDALALFQVPEMHERLNAKESLERMPAIRSAHLLGSYIYSDAYMDDDRLVHETLRSANENGALSANYVKATGAKFKDDKITEVLCEDQISKEKFSIKTRHVISSVGPWTDEVGHTLLKDWKNILRPTKGIHLTLPKNRLPLTSAVVMAAEKSDRIVFGIPRHEMIIIGTTDTDYKESPEDVMATPEDVKYLLSITRHYFPGAEITAHDVIASYAGVRPLVNDGSSTEGKTSREHTIIADPRGITFVAGGKYTTYRLMCQQTVNKALEAFSFEEKVQFAKADTTKPLNPYTSVDAFQQAQNQVDAWAAETGRPLEDVKHLAERYGLEAAEILEKYPENYSYWQLEAAQAIDMTMCLHMRDFWARRVPLFLADRNHGVKVIDEVGAVFQEKLGWSDARLDEEKHLLTAYMAREVEWKKHF
ncbi:glycerol-3-phosphate dehydrogenase/oxidase [Bdellovibrio sp. 22V]|uniref:glycerol-3-phosphate dehydrogenase/oxidase n=1 Tax=Bdellovibrio sp. 22V TaxID=3044166 RepID=UPI002542C819|nr:glycerol-3-phosphate dehydrogenase/oxidase [Bdellovibrio sp. 22V]WII70796.1 glycerol-3-phosphate dehydrogenase/oxidase [Bdellovibrio sp. 22V]